jgi:hypothetical protein
MTSCNGATNKKKRAIIIGHRIGMWLFVSTILLGVKGF